MEIKGLVYSETPRKHFASDNNAPVHPAVMGAIQAANQGHTLAYGNDFYTGRARKKLKQVFGEQSEAFFVFTGTAANVLSMVACTRPFHSVICAESAHLNVAECSAPERFAGVKLLPLATQTGKIDVAGIQSCLTHLGDQHHAQPKVVSLTQATDLGYFYGPEELAEICQFSHQHNLIVHVDGARIFNACAAAGVSLKQMTADVGVDVLSLGGTKNGLLGAEAVVFLNSKLAEDFAYIRKQGMQLASKMRFLAVQFEALLSNDLWLENAQNANHTAQLLAQGLQELPGVQVSREVQTNMVYATIPAEVIADVWKEYLFYIFDEQRSEVRLVTSYDTDAGDVKGLLSALKAALAKH